MNFAYYYYLVCLKLGIFNINFKFIGYIEWERIYWIFYMTNNYQEIYKSIRGVEFELNTSLSVLFVKVKNPVYWQEIKQRILKNNLLQTLLAYVKEKIVF